MQTNRQIHSVFGRYFWYILINSLLRKTSWILGGLCILVGIIFLFVIPSATQLDPFALWINPLFNPQMFTLYVVALLGAIFAICIFNDPIENGSELIIVSKPITRFQLITAKFLALFATIIIFTCLYIVIIAFMNLCYGFLLTGAQMRSILLSLFVSTSIVLIALSSIGALFALCLPKIWVFILNFIVVLVLIIYGVITRFAFESPLQSLLSDNDHIVTTCRVLDQDGNPADVTSISKQANTDILSEYAPDINNFLNFNAAWSQNQMIDTFVVDPVEANEPIYNLTTVKNAWEKYSKKANINGANAVNLSLQFQTINKLGMIDDINTNAAKRSFGNDPQFTYHIDQKNTNTHNANITKLFDVWSNSSIDFINPSLLIDKDTKQVTPMLAYQQILKNTVFQAYMRHVEYIGNVIENRSKDLLTVTQLLTSFQDDTVPIGSISSVLSLRGSNTNFSNEQIINMSDSEKAFYLKVTKKIIRQCLNQSDKKYYLGDSALNAGFKNNMNWINSEIGSTTNRSIYDILHYYLISGKIEENDGYTNPLNITNDTEFAFRLLQYKYYLYEELINNTTAFYNPGEIIDSISQIQAGTSSGHEISLTIDDEQNLQAFPTYYYLPTSGTYATQNATTFANTFPGTNSALLPYLNNTGLMQGFWYYVPLFGYVRPSSSNTISGSNWVPNNYAYAMAFLNSLVRNTMNMGYSALNAYNPFAPNQAEEIKKYASDFTIQSTNFVNLNYAKVNWFFAWENNSFDFSISPVQTTINYIIFWIIGSLIIFMVTYWIYYKHDFK